MINQIGIIYPVVQIKGLIRDYVWTLEFDMKQLKKAEGYIG